MAQSPVGDFDQLNLVGANTWPPQTFAPQGWQCPVCKHVYSPSMVVCSYCPPRIENATSTTTDATPKDKT